MTTLEDQPGYARLLKEHAQRVCAADTEVDLHGAMPGTHSSDLAPIQAAGLAWLAELNALQIVENVIRAEREGYDAVAMSCFGDPQLDACRGLVDIPVVSAFENSLLVASTCARAFGLLVPTESAIRNNRKRVRHYGFEHRVAAIAACDPPLTEYEMERAFEGGPIVDQLVAGIRGLIRQGADIIIPAEGVLNALLVRNGIASVDGAPVFDSFGALVANAEMLVRLQRSTGLRNARRGSYSRPDAAQVARSRRIAIRALTEAADREPAPPPARRDKPSTGMASIADPSSLARPGSAAPTGTAAPEKP
jgi:Asp/Glu/hydantoin racemase